MPTAEGPKLDLHREGSVLYRQDDRNSSSNQREYGLAELKAVYKRRAEQSMQRYRLSFYVFYPRELEAVQINFFSHMFQTIHLHTPEVKLIPAVPAAYRDRS